MDASGEKLPEGAKENGKAARGSSEQDAAEGGCCPAWNRLLPLEYRDELKHLCKLAGPVVRLMFQF